MALKRALVCADAFSLSETASHLMEQKERLERAMEGEDCPLVLDASKALMESVLKTVLSDRIGGAKLDQDMNPLYRSVRDCLRLNVDAEVNDKLTKLTNAIVHNVSELRNKYGAASHGDDGYFENPISPTDAEFIASVADVFSSYIYMRHKETSDPGLNERIYYQDYPEFNDWLDGQYPLYPLPTGGEVSASEIIFKLEMKMYREMLLQYRDTQTQDEEDDES